MLDDSQKKQLNNLLDLESEAKVITEDLYYSEGFKLGLQIGVETYKE